MVRVPHKSLIWFASGIASLLLVACATAIAADDIKDEAEQPTVTVGLAPVSDPSQTKILADGSVSHEEMEQALMAVVECLRASGYDASLAEFRPRAGYRIELNAPTDTAETQEAQDADYARCEATYLGFVLDAYSREHRPSRDEVDARNRDLAECLGGLEDDKVTGADLEDIILELRVKAGEALFSACDEATQYPLD